MMVRKIEKIVKAVVVQTAERGRKNGGLFECNEKGNNLPEDAARFSTLDEVAVFLRASPRRGFRMNPGWSLIRDHIHIDGVPL